MKKLFSFFTNTVLALLILLGALVAFSALPIPGGTKLFTVQSGSMEPTIKTGSVIFTKPQENYAVGDIVTQSTNEKNTTITHRIVEISQENGKIMVLTKGDANDSSDGEAFEKEKIIGKVFLWIPFLGFPVSYAKTPQGIVLIIIIPAVIIIYDEIQKIKKEVKRELDVRLREKEKASNSQTKESIKN